MGRLWVVALVALVGCKELAKRAARDTEVHPVPELAGPGLAPGTYRIASVYALAAPFKVGTKPWDKGDHPAPDLSLAISLDGARVATCTGLDDRYDLTCHPDTEIRISAHSALALDVEDRDDAVPDTVGHAQLEDPRRWSVHQAMPMTTTRGLAWAAIALELVWAPPIGLLAGALGAGAGLGGLAIALARRRLFTLAARPPLRLMAKLAAIVAAGLNAAIELGAPPALFLGVLGAIGFGVVPAVAQPIHRRGLELADVGALALFAAALVIGPLTHVAIGVAAIAVLLYLLAN